MKKIVLAACLALILMLSACTGQPPAATQPGDTAATQEGAPQEGAPLEGEGYPSPAQNVEEAPGYAAPEMAPSGSGAAPEIAYPAKAEDENLSRGEFMLERAELRPNPDDASKTDLWVTGSLPTPCNMIRTNTPTPDSNNQIVVEVYSVIEKDQVCTQNISPFEGVLLTLGGYPAGTYTVVVNGQNVGDVTVQ